MRRYELFFIERGRRDPVYVNVATSPTATRAWRQPIEATPRRQGPEYLIRVRDRAYDSDYNGQAKSAGIDGLITPIRAPRANTVAGRVIRTPRRECLDHLIVLDEQRLRCLLRQSIRYYSAERPRRSLGLEPPQSAARPEADLVGCRPVLGGLHYVDERGTSPQPRFCRPTGHPSRAGDGHFGDCDALRRSAHAFPIDGPHDSVCSRTTR